MSEKSIKELQLEELQEALGAPKEKKPKEDLSGRPEDLEIASLYDDCWEYEQELEVLKKELEAIENNTFKGLVDALIQTFPEEEKDFGQELKTVVETGWKQCVEVNQTHPKEQLELIQKTDFSEIADKLAEVYPEYDGDFEKEMRDILITRWKMYIEVKKEHIKEEVNYIKALGLKEHYAKRIYKRYHGIE